MFFTLEILLDLRRIGQAIRDRFVDHVERQVIVVSDLVNIQYQHYALVSYLPNGEVVYSLTRIDFSKC